MSYTEANRGGSYYSDDNVDLYLGDAVSILSILDSGSVDCIVTSPPYFGLRNYGTSDQIGAEESPSEYVQAIAEVFDEARRVLSDAGTLWLDLGDSYSTRPRGNDGGWDKSRLSNPGRVQKAQAAALSRSRRYDRRPKNLLGMPWRVAFALQDQGWILRSEIIWSKPNGMPQSVKDRVSTRHETVFMFTKKPNYYFDLDSLRVGSGAGQPLGRNPGDVWEISTQPQSYAHFATMPSKLARRCVVAGCPSGGTVLDPFSGIATTGAEAVATGRKYIGIDINREYHDIALRSRLWQPALDLSSKRSSVITNAGYDERKTG